MNELYIYAAADIIYLMRGRGCSSYVNSLYWKFVLVCCRSNSISVRDGQTTV